MPRRLRRSAPGLAVLVSLALAPAGCGEEPTDPLSWVGVRHIEEWPAERVQQSLAEGAARFVQPLPSRDAAPLLPGAQRLADEGPWPEALLTPGPPVVVVGRNREAVLRLAAQLARAGAPRVAVVTGDQELLRQLARIHTEDLGSGAEPSANPGIQVPDSGR